MTKIIASITAALLCAALTACTPTATGSTPTAPTVVPGTPTPTSSSTLSAQQNEAVAAVEGFLKIDDQVAADPSQYTEAEMRAAFKPFLDPSMLKNNVDFYMDFRKKKWRFVGYAKTLSMTVSKLVDTQDERGLEIRVTLCRDQSDVSVQDSEGRTVPNQDLPEFNLRQVVTSKLPRDKTWLVYGMETIEGKCP